MLIMLSFSYLSDSRNGLVVYGGLGQDGPLSDVWVSVSILFLAG